MRKRFASELLQRDQRLVLDCCPAFQLFREIITDPNGYTLDEAALAVGLAADPLLDSGSHLSRLDALAERLGAQVGLAANAMEAADMWARHLAFEEGFGPDRSNPQDERNYHLHEALKRHVGAGITLGILYIEVARRVGWIAHGVDLPGRFLVRLDYKGERVFLDPADKGRILTEENCREIAQQAHGPDQPWRPEWLAKMSTHRVILRLLRNLKGLYINNGEMGRALGMVQRILVLDPANLKETRDRGIIFAQLECYQSARRDFQHYLEGYPDEQDATLVRRHLEEISTERYYTLH